MTKSTFPRWILAIITSLGIFLLVLVLTTSGSPVEAASTANTYAVTWYTVDNGGGISSSVSYEIAGTIGQMDAASSLNSTGDNLQSGFWAAFIDRLYEIFLPAVIK